MFWCLYKSPNRVEDPNKPWPIILWLQGGPGASGVGIGNFLEIGPQDVNLRPRTSTWLAKADLLFVDSPVGTGYSYVEDETLLVKTDEEAVKDLTKLLIQVFNNNNNLTTLSSSNAILHIIGESYGGRLGASLALSALNATLAGDLKLKLGGVTLGSTWTSPEDSVADRITYGDQDTKLFHAWVKKRRAQTHLTVIAKEDGEVVEGKTKVAKVLVEFYQNQLGRTMETEDINPNIISMGELAAAQERLKKEVELMMKQIKELTNSVEIPTFKGRNDPEEVELMMKQIKELTNSVEIPTFEGRNDPEKFSKWLAKVEDIFILKDVPEDKRVKLVVAKFQRHASTWWASVASKRKLQAMVIPPPKICPSIPKKPHFFHSQKIGHHAFECPSKNQKSLVQSEEKSELLGRKEGQDDVKSLGQDKGYYNEAVTKIEAAS
ncbi:unnamed protein product [Cuscuta campestris]|uniref:Carboxypeptidase n=1 Tax=Cuscuta campestris TaxID=132261 RepID=A0A484N191_9ASTE|nr:unnamed protein product [Cuscuta campestris]